MASPLWLNGSGAALNDAQRNHKRQDIFMTGEAIRLTERLRCRVRAVGLLRSTCFSITYNYYFVVGAAKGTVANGIR